VYTVRFLRQELERRQAEQALHNAEVRDAVREQALHNREQALHNQQQMLHVVRSIETLKLVDIRLGMYTRPYNFTYSYD
jgi:hypothetical protein